MRVGQNGSVTKLSALVTSTVLEGIFFFPEVTADWVRNNREMSYFLIQSVLLYMFRFLENVFLWIQRIVPPPPNG